MSHLRTVLPYFRPYRRGLVVGLLLVVVSNFFTVLGPWLLRLAIDALEDPGVTVSHLATYAGLIVLAALVGGAAKYGMRELLNGISRRVECDLRSDFFRHLLRLDAAFFGRERTGDIMARATNDTLAVRQAAGPAVMYSVNTAVMSVFALSLMLWISPRLTGLTLIPMILLPPAVLGFGRIIHRRFERIQEQFSAISTQIQEALTGVRLVRAYGQEEDQARRFALMNREYADRNMHLVKAAGLFHPLLGLFTGIAMVIVLWIGGQEVMAGRISVGDFVAFIFYLNLLTWPMIALGWVVNLFQRGEASMGRINSILDTPPASIPTPGRKIHGRRPPGSASRTSPSGTRERSGPSWRTSPSRWSRARPWPWWDPPARGRARSSPSSLASTTPPRAESCWTERP
jgi:ATP-binding cassette, subfamily B, multidrug efflux pump